MTPKLTGWWCQKKTITIFGYKQRLLSINMKTKVVQHVPRIKISIWPLTFDIWHVIDSMTNNHFWAYTWKQKLFRTTTGCQKDRKTCQKTDWQKDRWRDRKTERLFSLGVKTKVVHFTSLVRRRSSHLSLASRSNVHHQVEVAVHTGQGWHSPSTGPRINPI